MSLIREELEELSIGDWENVTSELRMINNYNSTLFSEWLFSFHKYFKVELESFKSWKVRRISGKFNMVHFLITVHTVRISLRLVPKHSFDLLGAGVGLLNEIHTCFTIEEAIPWNILDLEIQRESVIASDSFPKSNQTRSEREKME